MQPEASQSPDTGRPEQPYVSAGRPLRQAFRRESITVFQRNLDAVVCEALDAVPAASLPQVRALGTPAELRTELRREFGRQGFGPAWLSGWLAEDVHVLTRMFEDLVGAQRLVVRLEIIANNACRRFHTDNVRFRLVTTYRGPGSQWMPTDALASVAPGDPLPSSAMRQLDRGHVAVMRGGKDATVDRPGVLHRSPPIEETGITRLFLAIDDAADHDFPAR